MSVLEDRESFFFSATVVHEWYIGTYESWKLEKKKNLSK